MAAWHTWRQAQLVVVVVGGSSQKLRGLMGGSLLSIPDGSGPVLTMFDGAVGSPREENPRGFVPNEWVPAEVPGWREEVIISQG